MGKKLEKDACEKTEEYKLLSRAVKANMDMVKSGKIKTYKLEDVLREENKRRGLS